jgi:hypothetical protein
MLRLTSIFASAVALIGLLACDETDPTGTDLTTTREGARVAVADSTTTRDSGVAISASSASLLGTIPLPISQSVNSSVSALYISQQGSGGAADFRIDNASNGGIAISGRTIGPGTAVAGITPAGTGGTAVDGTAYGGGMAGHFRIANSSSPQTALLSETTGGGAAVKGMAANASSNGTGGWFEAAGYGTAVNARNIGNGPGGVFTIIPSGSTQTALRGQTYGTGYAVHGIAQANGNAGVFENLSGGNTKPALYVKTNGTGWTGAFISNNTAAAGVTMQSKSSNVTLDAENSGSGFAAKFFGYGSAKGVYIQTQGGAGLQVVGGSKNAVVHTPSGAKALYTEESTEVWFTDYGFGKLTGGKVRILFDPSFAQTINPEDSYHVFVQPYGRAELYVAERTPLGFTVTLKDGDPNAEFSYRIVAKRLGFEGKRLEAAPWADQPQAGN